jgi:hypothetical protein
MRAMTSALKAQMRIAAMPASTTTPFEYTRTVAKV